MLHYNFFIIHFGNKIYNILNCDNSKPLTNLKHKRAQDALPGPARQPQEQGVRARAPLRLGEVVEQLRPGLLYLHVPASSHIRTSSAGQEQSIDVDGQPAGARALPGLQVEGKRAIESRQVGDHRRCRRRHPGRLWQHKDGKVGNEKQGRRR